MHTSQVKIAAQHAPGKPFLREKPALVQQQVVNFTRGQLHPATTSRLWLSVNSDFFLDSWITYLETPLYSANSKNRLHFSI
jgi:hypothetical protein